MIDRHAEHDDAIFFLGRLVWQGAMSDCVAPLLTIAADSTRGPYARIAAARAVVSCGSNEQQLALWTALLKSQAELPRRLLAEIVRNTAANKNSVTMLLESINKLPPYVRLSWSGLTHALHGFIDRLPLTKKASANQPLAILVRGLDAILDRPPYIDRRECRVSQNFAWLLGPATHAVERLVDARAETAIQRPSIAITHKMPAALLMTDNDFEDYEDKLYELLPAWPELTMLRSGIASRSRGFSGTGWETAERRWTGARARALLVLRKRQLPRAC